MGIFPKGKIKQILSGEIQVELRHSNNKLSPFLEIESGDIVYIKPPGEEIIGQFLVKKVIFTDNLDDKDLELFKKNYTLEPIKKNYKFVTIIFIDQVEQFITSPIKFNKRNSKNWVILT